MLCRFYVILFCSFLHFIKKYNSVPLYFISFFNFDDIFYYINFDAIKYNGTLLYFLIKMTNKII